MAAYCIQKKKIIFWKLYQCVNIKNFSEKSFFQFNKYYKPFKNFKLIKLLHFNKKLYNVTEKVSYDLNKHCLVLKKSHPV